MAKKKLRPGTGAKCSIVSRFLHPKQTHLFENDNKHRSNVILVSKETKKVNGKMQECYNCSIDGIETMLHAVKTHFKLESEGNPDGFFVPLTEEEKAEEAEEAAARKKFKEPKTKWKKSQAKSLLYNLIMEGVVPDTATDENGKSTMPLQDIYLLDPEFAKYDYTKFSSRLGAIRKKIKELNDRSIDDLAAFELYKQHHKPSLFSHKGYIQWQGSTAQEFLWEDMEKGLHKTMKPQELWNTRDEYKDEFPLHAFRSKLEQEIRTAKYLYTLKERGVTHRAS